MRFKFCKMPLHAGFGLFLFAGAPQASTFDISFNFTNLTDTEQSYFSLAENYWESLISGYASRVTSSLITGITISASAAAIDGVNGTLGQTSIDSTWFTPGTGGYVLAKTGTMSYDSADIDNMIVNGTFTSVIEHEMAHVLGFGSLWTANRLYAADSGQYTGAYGLAAYRSEFDSSATYVPVELEGAVGTANGHWNELANGAGLTGVTDANGRDMQSELMTGWLNSPTFLSNTTIQSFRDLGYTVAAVPLPAAVWLFGSFLAMLLGFSTAKRRP